LVSTTTLPVVVVTQSLNLISAERFFSDAQTAVQEKEKTFAQQYILSTREEAKNEAETIAQALENAGLNRNNLAQLAENRTVQQALTLKSGSSPETIMSFKIVTDAQGKTVAQQVQTLAGDLSRKPLLPPNGAPVNQAYEPVDLPSGIALGDLPIVQAALKTGRSLAGVELIKSQQLKRLGLDRQADIGLRPQITAGLPAAKQPLPEGTYDIDAGKAGLTSMAVYPIKVSDRVVGTAVVGVLLNRNYGLADTFRQNYDNKLVATIFAQDWRVTTNVPYVDPQTQRPDDTRALGTRVSREVAEAVLNQRQTFVGKANIVGVDYLTGYSPLYDHRQELDPKAKPVGMSFVGQPLTDIKAALQRQQLIGYGIGAGMIVFVGLIAIPLADSFSRPIRRLTGFAQQVAQGDTSVRLEGTERQDEIGELTRDLNQMAIGIEANLNTLRQEAVRDQILKAVTLELSQFPQVKTALDRSLEELRQGLKADRALIYRFDEKTWHGAVIAESVSAGWPQALESSQLNLGGEEDQRHQYAQGEIQAIADLQGAGLPDSQLTSLAALAVKASLVVPILRGSRRSLAGLLAIHQCSSPRTWQEAEGSLLVQVATQIGLSFDRASLLEQSKGATKRAQILKNMVLNFSQAPDVATLFETGVREVRQALQVDRAIVYRFDESWQGTIVAESVGSSWPKALGAQIADPCFAQQYVEKYRQGRVQATEDIDQAGLTPCHLKQLEPFAVKANLVAPILLNGELMGLLIAHQCSAPRRWEKPEIDFFTQAASQVGLAIERLNLLEQQRSSEQEQRRHKEELQQRALELLMEVDPVSQGNLTVRARITDDEIGTIADSYNATVENLRKIVTQVQQAAEQLAQTAHYNGTFVQTLSSESAQQTQEVEAALHRIQSLSKSGAAVAANAQQATQAVRQAVEQVKAGDLAMNRTVDGILNIRETVTETAHKVKKLGESSEKISQVVNLIGRFAAQTHLLALKASIEAARAGEEGRGFAVIADEVRTLAQQSAEATADISTLVSAIQSETNQVVAAMEAGTEQVAIGTQLVQETRQNLTQISQASQEIDQLVEAISRVAAEQSQASQSVTQTMTKVAAIADNTSHSASNLSASFSELLAVAQELQASVGQFKVK
jgi:methyl-accepting chemotaxis protein PixJ